MSRPSLSLPVIPIALCIFWGCASTQESVDAGAVSRTDKSTLDAQTDSKVGVVNIMSVINQSKVGQPALTSWKLHIQEATQQLNAEWQKLQELDKQRRMGNWTTEYQYRTQSQRYAAVYQSYNNASFAGYIKAVAQIMPK